MVQAAQPRLMKRVASFLLASGPLWSPPPSTRSWPPHNHLYSSPKRFPVESQLWLGCSHKIPNRASVTSKLYCRDAAVHSMALGLSQCSTVPSNTILGPCSQGPSRHVLPHAAPGFFVGREYKGWWSSPNFASILLAPRDDILALCSGGRTQSHGVTILSSGVAMVFSLGLSSHGSRPPIYSNGAQHRSPFTSQMRGNLIRTLFACGAQGLCLLSEALARLQQA
jgi:hypothetical protein